MTSRFTRDVSPACRIAATLTMTLILVSCQAGPRPRQIVFEQIEPRAYDNVRSTEQLTIDGRLDESAWRAARWTDFFVDIRGVTEVGPRFDTRMKMLWDEDYLYIAAHLEEPHVWGTLTEHDQIVYYDNDFEVFIDPDGDGSNYYEIEINALNTIFDLLLIEPYSAGGPAVHDWDASGMQHAVHVMGTLNDWTDEDEGWSIEIALPWETLAPLAGTSTPPQPGDVWRMNFSRVEWRHVIGSSGYQRLEGVAEDNWVWTPQGQINMHIPQRWGTVRFVSTDG